MMGSRETMEHLFSCFDTMYVVAGENAVKLTNDAYVVRTYETARAMGAVALSFREYLGDVTPEPYAPLDDTLRRAFASDPSGAMALFALAVVVGPRMLVSLRDAREHVELDEAALAVVNDASAVLIREILAIGEVSKDQGPIDDEEWQENARSLSRRLDEGENAESFGISR
jgi:hypothetical protein